jgi:toxin YoeB
LSRRVTFSDDAWQDYLYWQESDRKILRKINALIKECQRTPEAWSGRPEQLRYEYAGWWSRRIE